MLETNKTVFFVSNIDPNGLFAKTPLRVGDIILSINEFSFRKRPDAKVASGVIQGVNGDLTVVARKSQKSLQEFLVKRRERKRQQRQRKTVETLHIPAPGGRPFEFDEESYGASRDHNYQASRRVKINKARREEDIGLTLKVQHSEWGRVLAVGDLSPSTIHGVEQLIRAGIKVGDVILEINGISFREENADAGRAHVILETASGDVSIEYQPLSQMNPALPHNHPNNEDSRSRT